jgi:hypothetical protein
MQSGDENGTFESRCKRETFKPVNAYKKYYVDLVYPVKKIEVFSREK